MSAWWINVMTWLPSVLITIGLWIALFLYLSRSLRRQSEREAAARAQWLRGEQLNGEFIDAPDNDTRRHQ